MQPLTPARAATAAVGIARAATGTGGTTDAQVSARLAACNACPHLFATLGVRRCGLCECVVAAKARNANQRCPDDRWTA